jgi:hypothetical protein
MTARQIRTEAPERAAHHYAGMAAQARRDLFASSQVLRVLTEHGVKRVRLSQDDYRKFVDGSWALTAGEKTTRTQWAVLRDLGASDQIRRIVELEEAAGRAETAGQAQRLYSQADEARRGLDKRFLRQAHEVERLREEASRRYEPGEFAAVPDTSLHDAFQRGMELGRKLERQDAGVHIHAKDQYRPLQISWEGFKGDDAEDAPFTPPPSRAGGRILLGLAVLAFVVAALQVLP